jgi:tetratricopeptide (TPR) repeat protein
MSRSKRIISFVSLAAAMLASGCTEVRGRKCVQEANKHYKDGNYKEAIQKFEEAETLIPDFPTLWLNKGYTCRHMLVPGAKTPENEAAAKCALDAFKRYMELAPNDSRGEMLYVQTLFDADHFETLAKMYEGRFEKNPRDIDSITGLIQVYTKWNKLEQALQWYSKKAEIQANDPEAQYAVGVFIWQQLSQKGGGPDKQAYDPTPDPNKPRERKIPPAFGFGDIVSQQRIDMADLGIQYLKKALEMKPKYHEAMTYLGLLNRQKSFAYLDDAPEWRKCVDEGEKWRRASLEAQGKPVTAPAPAAVAAKEDEAEEEAAPAPAKAAPAKKAAPKKKLPKGKRRK